MVLDELAEVIPDRTDPEKQVELKELSAALKRFVAGLEDTEAQIFLARCWYMTGVKEIAEKYGLTPGSVSTTLHRTRRKLQNYLKEEGLC
jgi:RNA polymerase sigma-70 factor (ECF subfamily)